MSVVGSNSSNTPLTIYGKGLRNITACRFTINIREYITSVHTSNNSSGSSDNSDTMLSCDVPAVHAHGVTHLSLLYSSRNWISLNAQFLYHLDPLFDYVYAVTRPDTDKRDMMIVGSN